MILKVNTGLCACGDEPDWVFYDNIDEVRVNYKDLKKEQSEPSIVRFLRNRELSYTEVDVSFGAYLMNDDGKTIEHLFNPRKV